MRSRATLAVILILVVTSIVYLQAQRSAVPGDVSSTSIVKTSEEERIREKEEKYRKAKELAAIVGYLNTEEGFLLADKIGKEVILIDFWTYSCINCQRSVPFVNTWHQRYRDKGLTIVGVHTPEFDFEKDIENVREATKRFKMKYPVVLDNDYGTWRAYQNNYWPRKYLIDIDGFIVYDHIGEGAYKETEKKIQELLEERQERIDEESNME